MNAFPKRKGVLMYYQKPLSQYFFVFLAVFSVSACKTSAKKSDSKGFQNQLAQDERYVSEESLQIIEDSLIGLETARQGLLPLAVKAKDDYSKSLIDDLILQITNLSNASEHIGLILKRFIDSGEGYIVKETTYTDVDGNTFYGLNDVKSDIEKLQIYVKNELVAKSVKLSSEDDIDRNDALVAFISATQILEGKVKSILLKTKTWKQDGQSGGGPGRSHLEAGAWESESTGLIFMALSKEMRGIRALNACSELDQIRGPRTRGKWRLPTRREIESEYEKLKLDYSGYLEKSIITSDLVYSSKSLAYLRHILKNDGSTNGETRIVYDKTAVVCVREHETVKNDPIISCTECAEYYKSEPGYAFRSQTGTYDKCYGYQSFEDGAYTGTKCFDGVWPETKEACEESRSNAKCQQIYRCTVCHEQPNSHGFDWVYWRYDGKGDYSRAVNINPRFGSAEDCIIVRNADPYCKLK